MRNGNKKRKFFSREALRALRILPFFLSALALSACEALNTATITGEFHPGIAGSAYNQAPTATSGVVSTNRNTAVTGTLLATDPDAGDTLIYSVVSQGAKGIVSITDLLTGAFTYTPNSGQVGVDSFTFKANDGKVD